MVQPTMQKIKLIYVQLQTWKLDLNFINVVICLNLQLGLQLQSTKPF